MYIRNCLLIKIGETMAIEELGIPAHGIILVNHCPLWDRSTHVNFSLNRDIFNIIAIFSDSNFTSPNV